MLAFKMCNVEFKFKLSKYQIKQLKLKLRIAHFYIQNVTILIKNLKSENFKWTN